MQNNPALVDWTPQARLISNITNSVNAVITTTVDHGYSTGMNVIVNSMNTNGLTLSSVTSQIVVLSSDSFQTNIDTSNQVAFSPPVSGPYTPAQVSVDGNALFFNSTPGSPTGGVP